MAKIFILHPILAYFTQILTTNFFSSKIWLHQSLDIMVKFHHVQCQKKLMLESWENWVTDRRTNKRMRLIHRTLWDWCRASKKSNFSINIDDCITTNSHKRVFSILVIFYNEILKKVVIKHYESVECILVNSLTLLSKIDYLLKWGCIPWENFNFLLFW